MHCRHAMAQSAGDGKPVQGRAVAPEADEEGNSWLWRNEGMSDLTVRLLVDEPEEQTVAAGEPRFELLPDPSQPVRPAHDQAQGMGVTACMLFSPRYTSCPPCFARDVKLKVIIVGLSQRHQLAEAEAFDHWETSGQNSHTLLVLNTIVLDPASCRWPNLVC